MSKKKSAPVAASPKPYVFLSHSSQDAWVAAQIATQVERCGADCFFDREKIIHGDDINADIYRAADAATELLVLMTPWALERQYVMIELGLFCNTGKRIVGVVHGLTEREQYLVQLGVLWGEGKRSAEVVRVPGVLRQTNLVSLNQIDSYFEQLKSRVRDWERQHGKKQ